MSLDSRGPSLLIFTYIIIAIACWFQNCFTFYCTSTQSLAKRQSMMSLFEFPEHTPETFLACSQRVGIILWRHMMKHSVLWQEITGQINDALKAIVMVISYCVVTRLRHCVNWRGRLHSSLCWQSFWCSTNRPLKKCNSNLGPKKSQIVRTQPL